MKKLAGLCACLSVVLGGGAMVAQDMAPPKVLVIDREFTKPGKDGSPHQKSESAFVSALTAAKWPSNYFAMTSMSGRPRALFLFAYDSFAAWEKDNQAMDKNAVLSATLDRLNVADGALLDEVTVSVFVYQPELSVHVEGGIVHSRYFEISQYHVKPGHRAEFLELVNLYKSGYEKIPTANWATYASYYGEDNGGLFLAITKLTSLAENDANMGDDDKFAALMGKEKMQKVRELTASSVESVQTNLFRFDPKMSYPPAEWIKEDSFWKPKPMAASKPAAPANP